MSYSRWSDSHWYTYYTCSSGFTKDTQRFEINCDITFTYKELKEDMYRCLKEVSKKDIALPNELMIELQGYMDEFISDVENSSYFKVKINDKEYEIIKDEHKWRKSSLKDDIKKFYSTDEILKQIEKDIEETLSILDKENLIKVIDEQKMLMELDK